MRNSESQVCSAQSDAFVSIVLTILVRCRTTSAPSSRSESSESDILMKHKNTACKIQTPFGSDYTSSVTSKEVCFPQSTSSEPHLLPDQCCQVIYHDVIYHVAMYFTPWNTIFTRGRPRNTTGLVLSSSWAGFVVNNVGETSMCT